MDGLSVLGVLFCHHKIGFVWAPSRAVLGMATSKAWLWEGLLEVSGLFQLDPWDWLMREMFVLKPWLISCVGADTKVVCSLRSPPVLPGLYW